MNITFQEWLLIREAKKNSSTKNMDALLGGGYKDSPVLKYKDEFVGPDSAKQAEDCGLAMCPHQLGVGRMMTDKRTTNKRLNNTGK
jgi:hypothetical protein